MYGQQKKLFSSLKRERTLKISTNEKKVRNLFKYLRKNISESHLPERDKINIEYDII
jgi:hypothetical protein